MTRTRASDCLAIASAALGLAGALVLPVARADTLPNGLTVTCNQDSDVHATCIIGGCPRVNGDHVVDYLHVLHDGASQQEYDFKCINGQTHREPISLGEAVPLTSPQGFGVQACRKNTGAFQHDDCTEFSHYVYTPPAKAAAPAPPAAPAAPPKPIRCTGGLIIPADQTCPAAQAPPAAEPAPTNAVSMSFQRQGLSEVASFKNSSKVSGQCHYSAHDANGLLPAKTDDFPIGPNATVTRTYPAPPPLDTYNATVTCHGNFNGQDVQFGNASQSVTG